MLRLRRPQQIVPEAYGKLVENFHKVFQRPQPNKTVTKQTRKLLPVHSESVTVIPESNRGVQEKQSIGEFLPQI